MRTSSQSKSQRRRAYTITEAMVAVGVFGTLFTSLYVAFSAGFTVIRVARENLRATQLLVQRQETLRLYTWAQLNDATYFKTNFADVYEPLGTTFHGSITKSQPANMGNPSYLGDMLAVTITVKWTNGIGKPSPHIREMQTQVARNGLQNYVYGGHTQ